jgi:hypothetical protein
MLRFVALLCICAPLNALGADLSGLVEQNIAFSPRTRADGTKEWRFVTTWPLKYIGKRDPEPVLAELISQEMGKKDWCKNGWEEVSREFVMKRIVIDGRCK